MIELKGLTKEYDKKTIFNDINIVFPKHTINFVLGRNGVGKTTLYKCILGLESYKGEVIMNENKLYCVFDNHPFYYNLSGFDNIELYKKIYGIHNTIPIDYHSIMNKDILKKKVKKYSYGQKKKLALLLVDIIQPDILLLDEASNGLDYESIKFLKVKLAEWKKNMTIIISGHQLDFYDTVVESIFVMKDKSLLSISRNNRKLEEIYDTYIG